MSATNFTPIQLYRTSTAAAVPTAGNLAAGELAINLTDERLYFKNAAGVVKLLASNSGSLGTVTSVDVSGGTTGLTTSGGPITSSGTITLAGTLGVANGGTGTATAFTAGSVVFAGASGVYTQDNANFFWDNTNDRLGIGTASPATRLHAFGGQATITSPTANAISYATREDGLYFTRNDLASIWRNKISNSWSGDPSFTTMNFELATGASTNATVMTLLANGSVGIGTTAPGARLDIGGGDIFVRTSGRVVTDTVETYTGGATPLTLKAANTIVLTTASTERMRITSAGDVGIGTSSPADRLHVSATGTAYGSGYIVSRHMNAVSEKGVFLGYDADENAGTIGGANFLTFQTYNAANAWGERMRIDSAGDVGIGTTTPEKLLSVSNAGANGFEIEPREGNFTRLISYNRSTAAYTPVLLEGLDLRFLTNNGNEQMRITSAGDVGIGTSSPARRLTVSAGAGLSVLAIQDVNTGSTATDGFQLQLAGNGDGYLWNYENATMVFGTNDTERMRVSATGNVGIGVASPVQKLDVDGSIVARTGGTVFTDSVAEYSGGGINLTVGTTGARDLVLRTNNTEKARIDTNGNFGLGTATPTTYAVGSDRTLAIAGSSFASLNLVCGGSFSGAGLTVDSSANLQFRNVGVERMRIDNAGNVTLANKIIPNVQSVASASTITPNANTDTQVSVTALAVPATIAAPSGTPSDGQTLVIRIEDNGTARALTWTTGSSGAYRPVGVTLPTTTVASKTVYIGCKYNSTDLRWDVIALSQEA